MVKFAGSDSEAVVSSLATDPEVHVTAIVTSAVLLSEKSLFTTTWALRSVFVMVHDPALNGAAHVALDE